MPFFDTPSADNAIRALQYALTAGFTQAPSLAPSGGTTSIIAAATGGASVARDLDIDESENEIKATAGTLYKVIFTNTATATRWLKVYNATAANVTVGTTTPIMTIGLPGATSGDDVSGVLDFGDMGIAFDTAITMACVTEQADNGTTAPGANEVTINVLYK